jgi:predicted RNase H-like HicB family nuclease
MNINCTVIIQKEDKRFNAKCIENSVVSQGSSIDEAMSNLKEALELYFEDDEKENYYSPVINL